ncbi:FtsX-like permease family protein [Nocardioides panacisoli]|uniref:ABC3 transporter permease C-terminal domain-containing protein n=1 Tax=Nocardioides panacisoli TaxID=627624 RepID=A0ABP7I6J7_9ACTN
MFLLVLRRALVQRRLLAAAVALVATACTLVGTCTLVLDVTQDRGFREAAQRSDPDELSVTAFLVDVTGRDSRAARAAAAHVVERILAPMDPALETTTTSRLRSLVADGAPTGSQAYLVATDALTTEADLTSGRWPAPAGDRVETVVPDTTARLLGLALGDELELGPERGIGGADNSVRLVVVGTFRPRGGVEWERDPLGGAGFSPAYSDGLEAAPTYGPFVIDGHAFSGSGSSVDALRVTAHPTLGLADDASLRRADRLLGDGQGVLSARVGNQARLTRLGSDLPQALAYLHAQQASTRSTVLVVLLLGAALALAAALLTGRLVGSVREDERDLLVAMGLGRRQQLGAAAAEAALLAVVASGVAVPAAALLHSRLTHRDDMAAAGLQQGPSITWALVVAVLATGALLATALVSAALRPRAVADPSPRARLARYGLDVLLLGAATLAWWQLRTQPATPSDTGDVILTTAPILCLAVPTVLGVRLVPPLLGRAAAAAGRARGFVLPVAIQQAARRAYASTAMVLVAAAVAAAVFALALHATWDRSQQDQASLRVGTDLALTLRTPPDLRDAQRVEAAAAGQSPAPAVSPVVHRPLALGRYVGEEGARPVLVAVDSREAGALLRGRPDTGDTWAGIGGELAPEDAPDGIPLPDGGKGVVLRGRGPAGTSLTARVTAVLEDRNGFRGSVSAGTLPLDGRSRPLEWATAPSDGLALVAVRLEIAGSGDAGPGARTPRSTVQATVTVPATAAEDQGDDGAPWRVLPLQKQSPVGAATAELHATARGVQLRTSADVNLEYFSYTGADVLVTVLPAPPLVPVAVSQDLVDAVGAKVGDELAALVGDTALRLEVVAVVPDVPSAPGQVAVLADIDTVSRALIDVGSLDPVVDGWWFSSGSAGTVTALEASGLGTVTTRDGVAAELARGPLRVAVPTTLLVLAAPAMALFLAAVALVVGADRSRASPAVAVLRAIGAPRRDTARLQLAEHLVLLLPLTVVGTVVGAAATVLVGPHLIRSDVGAAPVPTPVVDWPWPGELAVVGGLVLAVLVVTWLLTSLLVRQSHPSRLRDGGL